MFFGSLYQPLASRRYGLVVGSVSKSGDTSNSKQFRQDEIILPNDVIMLGNDAKRQDIIYGSNFDFVLQRNKRSGPGLVKAPQNQTLARQRQHSSFVQQEVGIFPYQSVDSDVTLYNTVQILDVDYDVVEDQQVEENTNRISDPCRLLGDSNSTPACAQLNSNKSNSLSQGQTNDNQVFAALGPEGFDALSKADDQLHLHRQQPQPPSLWFPQTKVHIGQVSSSPSRTARMRFTCAKCSGINIISVNPHAFHKGAIFARCLCCKQTHIIKDNINIVDEILYKPINRTPPVDDGDVVRDMLN